MDAAGLRLPDVPTPDMFLGTPTESRELGFADPRGPVAMAATPDTPPSPLSRSGGDTDLGLRGLAGPDGVDPYAVPLPLPALPELPDSLHALRVGTVTR